MSIFIGAAIVTALLFAASYFVMTFPVFAYTRTLLRSFCFITRMLASFVWEVAFSVFLILSDILTSY